MTKQIKIRCECGSPRYCSRMLRLAALIVAWSVIQPAVAQVGLPQLPSVPLPSVRTPASPILDRLNVNDLRNTRLLEVRGLLRQHRDVIEADPRGAPIVRGEVVAISPDDAAISRVVEAGFDVLRTESLDDLAIRIVVLAVPEGVSTSRALQRVRKLDPAGQYDYNHVYLRSGETTAAASESNAKANVPSTVAMRSPGAAIVTRPTLGLIDGGVQKTLPVFSNAEVTTLGCDDGALVPSAHGTAVASLLMGVAAGAKLFAIDVYCGQPTGGSAVAIARAFAVLASENVPVVNVSLVGPRNALLEAAIRAALVRGQIVVAAVGNDGPNAPPLYPAAYAGVVGVTGIDARQRALVEAVRGDQVWFAARGADANAAALDGGTAVVRGTSFAAPIVAGLLATHLASPDPVAARAALLALEATAIDLGPSGRDRTYGVGAVGEPRAENK